MGPGLDPELLDALGKLIKGLERFNLEGAVPEEFDAADLLEGNEQTFFRICGLSDFWSQQNEADFWQYCVDLVIGAHNHQQADLVLVMLGTPRRLSLYISLGAEQSTRTLLEGIFPGVVLEPVASWALSDLLRPHFLIQGVLTGIPSRKPFGSSPKAYGEQQSQPQQPALSLQQPATGSTGQQDQPHLERVIRGMYGATWAYVVQAHPRPHHKIVDERMKTVDLLTQVTSRSRVQWQSTQQGGHQFTSIETGSQTQTYSGDLVNYRAQYLMRLLERELERLDQAAAVGQWTVYPYFGAGTIDDAQRLASLLLGTLAGPDSRPEPLRATLCQPSPSGISLESFHTFLTSHEVATLIQFPREEVPGYAVHNHVRFDVDFSAEDATLLPLGYIQQNGRDTCNTFDISLDALAKHAIVVGVTGSGKTTTIMNLLNRLIEAQKPFLVIEPAKTEYRALPSSLAPRIDLRIYTLGNEMLAPFRLNPFEFETGDEPGSASLLTHIDFLKAVFNAAFVLYAPMPHVLEEALHEVYEDKGWDLASGTNRRVSDWSQRHNYPIFPTLTDLYYKVEAVTNRLGYDQEVESNVKAGLKARIGSLRIGSKGLMLDTGRSIPLQELLSTPTVLEMEHIGNDDEKTFLMGLLLARLYEYRRLQAATSAAASGISMQRLQHLIVFEEAHRLLKNTATQVDTEVSNMRAQAIEVFTNMLSEMRAYGQGVLVAEQIPAKLAPDVLKNTNLKIVHRLIAQDDRESVGQTMNLNAAQQSHLGILTPGMAVVFAEGADHAYLVRLENYKRKLVPLLDAQLKQVSRAYAPAGTFQAIGDIAEYDVPLAPAGGPDPATYQAAGKLLDSEKSRWLWSSILLRLAASPGNVLELMAHFSELIEEEMAYLSPEQHKAVTRMLIVRGCFEMLHERGARLGWSYAHVEELRNPLTRGLLGLAQARHLMHDGVEQLQPEELEQEPLAKFRQAIEKQFRATVGQAANELAQFVRGYEPLMQRRQGPFAGCVHCPTRCLYRTDVSALLSPRDLALIDDEFASAAHETREERYVAMSEAAMQIAQNWLGEEPGTGSSARISGISYCLALHTIARLNFSEYGQALVSAGLKRFLLDRA